MPSKYPRGAIVRVTGEGYQRLRQMNGQAETKTGTPCVEAGREYVVAIDSPVSAGPEQLVVLALMQGWAGARDGQVELVTPGALLAEVARLRADCDELQRAAERAAAAENANAADLAAVKAERDALRAEVARLQVSLAATDEGLRAELDRMRAALAAAHREIAEDDEGYAGVEE